MVNIYWILTLIHLVSVHMLSHLILTKIIEVDTILLFFITVLWMRRTVSKRWCNSAKVAELIKLSSEQEFKPKHSDFRALLLHIELLPPKGIKMMRVRHVCINVHRHHLTENCQMVIMLYFLADIFWFFIISVRCIPTCGLPHYPVPHTWCCRVDCTATLGLPCFPFLLAMPPILRDAGRVSGHCPCRLAHLTEGVVWGGLPCCCRQFSVC